MPYLGAVVWLVQSQLHWGIGSLNDLPEGLEDDPQHGDWSGSTYLGKDGNFTRQKGMWGRGGSDVVDSCASARDLEKLFSFTKPRPEP